MTSSNVRRRPAPGRRARTAPEIVHQAPEPIMMGPARGTLEQLGRMHPITATSVVLTVAGLTITGIVGIVALVLAVATAAVAVAGAVAVALVAAAVITVAVKR